jgi:tetratricopeptide (TPR) repeat protein
MIGRRSSGGWSRGIGRVTAEPRARQCPHDPPLWAGNIAAEGNVRLPACLALVLAVGGCSAQSAQQATCKAPAGDTGKLRAKLAACADVIRQGAQGDDLETAFAQSGEAQRLLSNPGPAIADFAQALRLKPSDAMALNSRGLAYLDAGKSDLALADFNAAIRADPSDSDAFDDRGYMERAKGDYDAAIADESRAIELKPDAALAWANRGYDYAGKRQWDTAIADFDDALRLASDYAFALQGRAQAERAKGDTAAAIKDYTQMLANDPKSSGGLNGRAETYADKGDWDAALADANQAISSDPSGAWALELRSDIFLRRHDGVHALSDAQAAVAVAPEDPEALNARCWVRGVFNTQLAAALADCQRSLAIRPNSAEVLDSLAFVYFRQGRFADAANQYTLALASDPRQAQSRFMRGVARQRAGDQTGGAADIAAASAADKSVAGEFAGYGVKP